MMDRDTGEGDTYWGIGRGLTWGGVLLGVHLAQGFGTVGERGLLGGQGSYWE